MSGKDLGNTRVVSSLNPCSFSSKVVNATCSSPPYSRWAFEPSDCTVDLVESPSVHSTTVVSGTLLQSLARSPAVCSSSSPPTRVGFPAIGFFESWCFSPVLATNFNRRVLPLNPFSPTNIGARLFNAPAISIGFPVVDYCFPLSRSFLSTAFDVQFGITLHCSGDFQISCPLEPVLAPASSILSSQPFKWFRVAVPRSRSLFLLQGLARSAPLFLRSTVSPHRIFSSLSLVV